MAVETTSARESLSESETGFSTREQLVLLAIFAVALGLRLLHLRELQVNDPFFTIPAVDGRLYHAQAQAIAKGDFGEGVLFLGPFYPWLMAGIYKVVGPNLFVLKQLQAALGAIDCLLIAWLTRLHFGRAAALVAAGVAAVYGMLVFYGGTVMIVNVMVPLVLASAIFVTLALRDPSVLRFGLAGVVVGGAVLGRQTMLLYALVVFAWLFYALRERVPAVRRLQLAAGFGLGVALLVLPFTARNYVLGDDFVLLNSTGGISLYMGNNERANGAWVPPALGGRADNPKAMRTLFRLAAEKETGRELKASEVSSYWSARARGYALDHPGDWLRLELRKLLFFWNAREIWNNRSIDVSRDFSWVLRLPLVSFAVLAPFAMLGMGLAASGWRERFPLYAVVACYFGAGMIFFVLSRYRMPMVPVAMCFAGYAGVRLVAMARERRWQSLAFALGWLVVLGILVNRDMGRENLFMAHFNVGNKYRDLGRYEEAIESYDKSLAINGGFISTHNNLALAYEGAGRHDEAVGRWEHVLAWAHQKGDPQLFERAARHLRGLGALPPREEEPEP
jgi:tetratricopeptide (TPR) repeat protein